MSSADFNIFGKDRYGVRAYCFAFFFGPEYIPGTSDHISVIEGEVLPPRYGKPTRQQTDHLPAGWEPNSPPLYYGPPEPPYLPRPYIFNPNLFKAIETRVAARLDKIHGVASTGVTNDVFLIRVTHGSGDRSNRFSVWTDINWEGFRARAFAHMGIGPDYPGFLGYRQYFGVYTYDKLEDPSGRYGPLRPLTRAEDWEKAIAGLREASQEHLVVEMNIVRLSAQRVASLERNENAKTLPMVGLRVKTYYFEYPPVEVLLEMLGGCLEAQLVGFKGKDQISEVLRRAGLEYLDDFGLLSPRSLYIYDGVPADATRLLFRAAEEMIRAFHSGMDKEIREIEEMTGV